MSTAGRLEAFIDVPSGVSIAVTNSSGAHVVNLTADTYTVSELIAHLLACLTAQAAPSAGAWTVTLSTGASGTGRVTINCTGTWSITWTSTDLRDLLGFTGNIAGVSAAQTGTNGMRGLWLPGCYLVVGNADPYTAPESTDARSLESPGGETTTLVSACRYEHLELTWSHVAHARVFEHAATVPYTTWQTWVRDTQIGRGHSWFRPGSPFLVYYDDAGAEAALGAEIGANGPENGWTAAPAIRKIDPRRAVENVLAWWEIRISRIVSEG